MVFAQTSNNLVTIDGKVVGGNHSQMILFDGLSYEKLETIDLDNKKFHFEVEIDEESSFALFLDQQNYIFIYVKPGEKVNIIYDLSDLKKLTAEGSPGTEFYFQIKKDIANVPQNEIITFIDSVVNANLSNFVSISFARSLDFYEYDDTHKKLIKGLKKYKDNAYVKSYVKDYTVAQKTAIGAVPPEIELPDPDGNLVKLSSVKGQYVLIDFWAAWCGPCRRESPTLVKAYKNYHDKGFTIFSVSLDDDKTKWLKAIKDDNLVGWSHVSDLKGWRSAAGADYGVNSIPANYLIDKDGKIIAKDLRGNALEKKLSEIFDK